MFLILWAPWDRGAHKVEIVLPDGMPLKRWTLLPYTGSLVRMDWAQGINLPALPVEIPIDLAAEKVVSLGNLTVRFFVFWCFGIWTWYMVGRFVEDMVRWRRLTILPRTRLLDLVFAVEASSVAIMSLLVLIFGRGRAEFHVLTGWSAIWVVIAFAALAVRLFQVVHYRRNSFSLNRRPSERLCFRGVD